MALLASSACPYPIIAKRRKVRSIKRHRLLSRPSRAKAKQRQCSPLGKWIDRVELTEAGRGEEWRILRARAD